MGVTIELLSDDQVGEVGDNTGRGDRHTSPIAAPKKFSGAPASGILKWLPKVNYEIMKEFHIVNPGNGNDGLTPQNDGEKTSLKVSMPSKRASTFLEVMTEKERSS